MYRKKLTWLGMPKFKPQKPNSEFMNYIPIECCVWELVDAIKTGLLGEETAHTSLPAKLWKLTREAERVRKPACRGTGSEVAFEEPLAIQELPN